MGSRGAYAKATLHELSCPFALTKLDLVKSSGATGSLSRCSGQSCTMKRWAGTVPPTPKQNKRYSTTPGLRLASARGLSIRFFDKAQPYRQTTKKISLVL